MKLKVIIASVLTFLALSLGTLFYYASEKINGEELRKLITSSLEKKFPHAKVNVGDIHLGFGSSMRLTIEKIELTLPETKRNLFKVQNIGIKIPLLAFLGSSQNIKIHLASPSISYIKSGNRSDWERAAGKKRGGKKSKGKISSVPAFLVGSKMNIRLSDTKFHYQLSDTQKGDLVIRNFKLNNLGAEGNAAYELGSDISLQFAKHILETEILLIGQLRVSELIEKGILSTTSVLKVNRISVPSKGIEVPEFKTDIQLDSSPREGLRLLLSAVLNNQSRARTLIKVKDIVSLEDIDIDFSLKDLMNIFKIYTPNSEVAGSHLKLKGRIVLHPSQGIRPNINFSLGPQIQYTYAGANLSNDIKGTYKGSSLTVESTTKAFGGSLYGDLTALIDLSKPITPSKLPPFKVSLSASNLSLPRTFITSLLYPNTGKKDEHRKVPLLPRMTLKLNLKKILLAGSPFSLKGHLQTKNRHIKTKAMNFLFSEGSGQISLTSRLYREGTKNTFSLNFKNIDLKDIDPLLPKPIGKIEGLTSGKAQGNFDKLDKKTTYNIAIDFKAHNGSLQGLNIKKYFQKIIKGFSNIPGVADKIKDKSLKISNRFKKFTVTGRMKNDHWNFKRYSFKANKLSLLGNGNIFPSSKRKGSLKMNISFKKFDKTMLKNFGTKKIPVRFSGSGFSLKPDIHFTVKKLGKKHMEHSSKKKFKKVEKKIKDKIIDKILKSKGNKEKIKNLIKGLL